MKVFEVVIEREGSDKKVETVCQYVTAETDSMSRVVCYFEAHCEQDEEELVSVRHICTVVQHLE